MKIAIVEDDSDFAEILKESLEDEPDFEVVEVINNEMEFMELVRKGRLNDLHCVLLDLRLPRLPNDSTVASTTGLRLLEEIRHNQHFYGTIIVLTNSRDAADGKRALAAGCDGYLCKNAPSHEILPMLAELKVAMRGNVMIVASEMRHVFFRDDISAKEARLMDLLSLGHSWEDIARDLGYRTSKAAANIGDRVFDKLLSGKDKEELWSTGLKKRHKAVEIWRRRRSGEAQGLRNTPM